MTRPTRRRAPLAERFWRYVTRGGEDECWNWTGYTGRKGHGRIRLGRKVDGWGMAPAVSIFLHSGEMPPCGVCVLHRCDNPRCVNPGHLFLGTRADNNRDRHSKGRSNCSWGESHYLAKLTEEDVRQIRHRLANGEMQKDLGREFGVSRGTICHIKRGTTWKRVA